MKEIEVTIKNKAGLHARPSSMFVKVSSQFKSSIKVLCDGEEVDGKSIMGLMLLAVEEGRSIKLIANGIDENEMLMSLQELIEVKKFNEE